MRVPLTVLAMIALLPAGLATGNTVLTLTDPAHDQATPSTGNWAGFLDCEDPGLDFTSMTLAADATDFILTPTFAGSAGLVCSGAKLEIPGVVRSAAVYLAVNRANPPTEMAFDGTPYQIMVVGGDEPGAFVARIFLGFLSNGTSVGGDLYLETTDGTYRAPHTGTVPTIIGPVAYTMTDVELSAHGFSQAIYSERNTWRPIANINDDIT